MGGWIAALLLAGVVGLGSAAPAGALNEPVVAISATPTGGGYRLFARDGGVFNFGFAKFFGSMGGTHLNAPIVGGASVPGGYWEAATDGGVFAFGAARFLGSMGGVRLNQPIVGMTATPTGGGYRLFARDGGVFNFGFARFFGSMGGRHLNRPIVGGASIPGGYWEAASDGGIFAFGAARFFGSMGGVRLNRPIVAMAAHPSGQGYWLLADDGGVFSFGVAGFQGAATGRLAAPAVSIAATPDGGGYWITSAAGEVLAFGSARSFGSVARPPLRNVHIQLTRIATLDRPIAMAVRGGDGALYVALRAGRVVALRGGQVDPVLNISGQTTTAGERGLLGLTFSPDGSKLYVFHTDLAGDIRVAEYRMSGGTALASSRRQVLFIDHPSAANHNGGDLHFGADGHLYISVGDGGTGASANGQNLGTLLGKLLRIDPRPSGGAPYRIPGSNPFVGRSGRDEIWDFGLRNPWRFSFDRHNGNLWLGDVGQATREEIDFEPRGAGGRNYGWDRMEGTLVRAGGPPPGHVPPIFQYGHGGGDCAVSGGYVYRGTNVPDLAGAYLHGDLCTGRIRALRQRNGQVTDSANLGVTVSRLVAFGQNGAGELFVISLDGGIFRID